MSDAAYNPFTAPITSQFYATALLGPMFAARIVHFVLAGIMLSHFSAYLATARYAQDPRATKLLLWSVFLLDVANVALHFEGTYHYGTSQKRGYLDVYGLRAVDQVPYMVTACAAALLQSFLCRRASALFDSNANYYYAFLVIVHLMIFVGFMAEVGATTLGLMWIDGYSLSLWSSRITYNGCNSVWLFMQTGVDWICTISIYVLLRKRFEGNLKSVRQVMTVAFQTAGLTSFLTLLGALTAAALPSYNGATANVNCAFSTPLTSLYALSLIVTLASRRDRPVVVVGTTLAGFQPDLFADRRDGLRTPAEEEKHRALGGGVVHNGAYNYASDYEDGDGDEADEFGERDEDDEATAGLGADDVDEKKEGGRGPTAEGWRLDVRDRVAVAVQERVEVELRPEGEEGLGEFRPSRRGSVEAAAATLRGESRSRSR